MNPENHALWLEACKKFDAGLLEEAEAACKQLIALAPDKPMAYSLLSKIHFLNGQMRPATFNAFQSSQRAAGAHWRDIMSISSALVMVGETHLAHGVLSFINPRDPANRDSLMDLGRQYSALEDQARALRCIERAIANGQHGWYAHHVLGTTLSYTGPVDRAIAACEFTAVNNPSFGHGHWSRAQFGIPVGAEERVERIRQALTTPDLSNDDFTYLQYSLFLELDTLDRTQEAWPALMAGANARRSISSYNADTENTAFDALIAATSGDFVQHGADVPSDVTPIFIVGMPRTGTTLLERILGNHPDIATCGELNDFRQQMQWVNNRRLPTELDGNFGNFVKRLDYTVLGRRYLQKTHWLTENKKFYSDKHPMNFMLCGMILKALPHAKIIHLRRHPMDSCFSNLKLLFAKNYYPYSYALDELANHYKNYSRLMQHWQQIAPGRILDVHYEDLVSQPKMQAQRMQQYLGVKNVEGVTDILANKKVTTTASTLQLRQPIHTRNVGGWRRYQEGLVPLQALLAEHSRNYENR